MTNEPITNASSAEGRERTPMKPRRAVLRRMRPQSAYGQLLTSLNALYRRYLRRRTGRDGDVGEKTRRDRRVLIESTLRELHRAKFEIRSVENLRVKHFEHILRWWKEQGLQASTLSTYVSHLRTFSGWLEKPHLIRWLDELVAAEPMLVRRRTVAISDRSEQREGVDFEEIFRQALALDKNFAAQLALMAAFGLRSQEAWLFRPHLAEPIPGQIHVLWGTKGGRRRILPVPIQPAQRAILEWAKSLVKTRSESMIPRGWTLQRWRSHYYYLCRKVGLTRKGFAIVPHSLRHGVLLDLYLNLTGTNAPVRGGDLVREDPIADRSARQLVAQYAGHSRLHVASAYLGAVRPSNGESPAEPRSPESIPARAGEQPPLDSPPRECQKCRLHSSNAGEQPA